MPEAFGFPRQFAVRLDFGLASLRLTANAAMVGVGLRLRLNR